MFDGIAPPERSIRVVACPNPMTTERIEFYTDPETRVSDLVSRICPFSGLSAHVWIGADEGDVQDIYIPPEHWRSVRPKPGARVTIRIIPQGGGGGGILRTVLSIAVMAIAFFAAGPIAGALGFTNATAFTAFGTAVSWMQIGTGLVAMGISMVGSLLINALAPPPTPKLSAATTGSLGLSTNPTLTITGTQNRANPYGPVPRAYGKHRMFPPLAAAQYTENVGDEQYLRVLFDFGYGPLKVTDLRIGQTPLYLFQGVEVAVSNPDATWKPWEYVLGKSGDTVPSLYSNTVFTDSFSIKCKQNASQIVTTRVNVDEAEIDIVFQGLVTFDSNNNRTNNSVDLRVEYRAFGSTGPWYGVSATGDVTQPAEFSDSAYMAAYPEVAGAGYGGTGTGYWGNGTPGNFTPVNAGASRAWDHYLYQGRSVGNEAGWTGSGSVYTSTAATEQNVYKTFKAKFPSRGQYQIRVTRLTADNTSVSSRNDSIIAALRSIVYSPPTVPSGRCLLALRIKATNQLNGVIQNLSGVVEAMLPIWDGSSWSAPQITRNPAWAFCDVLRGSANKRPVSDSRIDLVAIKAWADYCDDLAQDGLPRFQFDAVYDSRSTIFQTLTDIASTARASLTMANFKFGVVVDKPQTTPVQMFTPRNSWGFRSKKTFVKTPHALRAKFTNPEKDWSQDEVSYFTQGYTKDNATLFESVEMFGVTRSNQVWRDLAFHYANGVSRPEEYEIMTDVENIVCSKGSLVRVAHDVPRFGLASARVKSLVTSGANITAIVIDEEVVLDPAKNYAIRARRSDGSQIVSSILSPGSISTTQMLTLAVPLPILSGPEVGSLVTFGESNLETVKMIVKNVYRQKDFTARLVLMDEGPSVYTADTGTIPTFSTQSTWPSQGANLDPNQPVIAEVRSDEEAMFKTANGFVPAIRLTFAQRSGVIAVTDYLEIQIRPTGSGGNWRQFTFPNAPTVVYLTPIDDGAQYDIRCRYVSQVGRVSIWTLLNAYTAAGRIALPPDVLHVEVHPPNIEWVYNSPPNDLAGFRVLWNYGINFNPSQAKLAHPAGTTVWSPFPLSAFPPVGTITVMVFAVDSAGNTSASPGVTLVRDAADTASNVIALYDFKANAFPGTRPETVIDGGDLAGAVVTRFWSDNPSLFWSGDGAATFWQTTIYSDFVYDFTYTPGIDDVPSWLMLDFTIEGALDYSVEYTRDGSGLAWDVDGGSYWGADADESWTPDPPYMQWPGIIKVGREKLKFRISATSGSAGGRALITELEAYLGLPDLDEPVLGQTLSAGGSRLPISQTFREIKNVRLDVVENGSGATSAKIIDLDPVLGPMVQAINSSGTGVAGKVNALIEGY